MFIRTIDQIAEITGKLAAWMFFAIGIFVTYEVFMRYVFIKPTIWVDEVSRIMQIWAAYIAGAYALKNREMIVIDVAFRNPHTIARKIVETFSLIIIVVFCAVTVWFGFELWFKATLKGHTTDSFLAPPKWLTHASVWIGFGLLMLQAFAEVVKVWTIGVNTKTVHAE